MNVRTLATLAVAIVLGLIAILILNSVLGSNAKRTQVTQTGATTPVVVAAMPIAKGAALQPTLLKVVAFPQASAPVGFFTNLADLSGGPQGPRLAMRSFTPGEPILLSEVTGPGGKLTLATVLQPGMQAVAIRSGDVQGVGGFVLPGDHVDVLLTRALAAPNGPVNTVTQILAQDVTVLGVDQNPDEDSTKPQVARAVTIQVTPDQAQAITLAQAVGSVSLSLRHVGDSEVLSRAGTQVAQLGFAPPPPRPAPRPAAAGPAPLPMYGRGIVRVTRVTDTTPYRVQR